MQRSAGRFGLILGLMATASFAPAGELITFNDGWQFTRDSVAGAEATAFDDAAWTPVNLPHDWSIAGPIARENPAGSPGGFFPTGVGWYRKSFDAPAAWNGRRVSIEFDGSYLLTSVYLNGKPVGEHVSGFSPFDFDLTPHLNAGGKNVLAVRVDNSKQPNARWYSGSGLYRHVRLGVNDPVRIARFGVAVTTPRVTDAAADLEIGITAENNGVNSGDAPAPFVDYATRVFEAAADGKPTGEPVAEFAPIGSDFGLIDGQRGRTARVSTKATLPRPKRWTPETPHLYVAVTTARSGQRVIDRRETTFGVRTIEVSTEKGFVLNGKSIELYGACVHDDNGALGVAAFDRAEVRRVEQLKAAGFNAVRTAHSPPAPAFLDACDRLGLIVIDEAFDTWSLPKNPSDFGHYFKNLWRDELDRMILRDRNHPSVAIWSLGNEIVLWDKHDARGLADGTQLIRRAKEVDPTRAVTTAVAGWNLGDRPWEQMNPLLNQFDLVGYNYAIHRYESDHQQFPKRVIVGTESFPNELFETWDRSDRFAHVIGDFVWTGIDYLGESGIGRYHHPDQKIYWHIDARHYPYHGAYCGDIDLTGFRKPISHQRNIVWNRGETLYTSVTDVTPDGRPYKVADWGVVPSRASWTWPGQEGRAMEVLVYSRHDAVRLYLNDTLVGEKSTTRAEKFKATFEVPYAPGTLKTVGVKDGREVETNELITAGPVAGLRLTADRTVLTADGQDLAYVTVESVDADGRFQPNGDGQITFAVGGPADIAGVASGDLGTTQNYQGDRRKLFQGRAQVVIRTGHSPGTVLVRAVTDGLPEASTRLTVK